MLAADGISNQIVDFELANDLIDLWDLGIVVFGQLQISSHLDGTGVVDWVGIAGQDGVTEFSLRIGDGTSLDASALTADKFAFAPVTLPTDNPAADIEYDALDVDTLRGGSGADVFVMIDDGVTDAVKNFEFGIDKIDVATLEIFDFDLLSLSLVTRKTGTPTAVRVHDATGEAEFDVTFGDGIPLSTTAFSEDDIYLLA